MVLADTSVWVDHLRRSNPVLIALLENGEVLSHPAVIGELSLGQLTPRGPILDDLRSMPQATVAMHQEVMEFIEQHKLFGLGIGYVDAHLLASTRLTLGAVLWTRDKPLRRAADRLELTANLPA